MLNDVKNGDWIKKWVFKYKELIIKHWCVFKELQVSVISNYPVIIKFQCKFLFLS